MSPALEGGFFTTGPPTKSLSNFYWFAELVIFVSSLLPKIASCFFNQEDFFYKDVKWNWSEHHSLRNPLLAVSPGLGGHPVPHGGPVFGVASVSSLIWAWPSLPPYLVRSLCGLAHFLLTCHQELFRSLPVCSDVGQCPWILLGNSGRSDKVWGAGGREQWRREMRAALGLLGLKCMSSSH